MLFTIPGVPNNRQNTLGPIKQTKFTARVILTESSQTQLESGLERWVLLQTDGTWGIHSPDELRANWLKPSEIWVLMDISNTPKNRFVDSGPHDGEISILDSVFA